MCVYNTCLETFLNKKLTKSLQNTLLWGGREEVAETKTQVRENGTESILTSHQISSHGTATGLQNALPPGQASPPPHTIGCVTT